MILHNKIPTVAMKRETMLMVPLREGRAVHYCLYCAQALLRCKGLYRLRLIFALFWYFKPWPGLGATAGRPRGRGFSSGKVARSSCFLERRRVPCPAPVNFRPCKLVRLRPAAHALAEEHSGVLCPRELLCCPAQRARMRILLRSSPRRQRTSCENHPQKAREGSTQVGFPCGSCLNQEIWYGGRP